MINYIMTESFRPCPLNLNPTDSKIQVKMLFGVCFALFVFGTNSTATGYDSWTCRPSQHNTPYTVTGATAPFFGIRLLGPNNTITNTYTPGFEQTLELYSAVTGAAIAGVTAAAFIGNSTVCPTSCSSANSAGALSPAAGVTYLRNMTRCSGGVTQTGIQHATSFKFAWTAPSNQTGPVTIWTIVVGARDTYEAVSASFTGLYVVPVPATPTPSPVSVSSVSVSPTLSIVVITQTRTPTAYPNVTGRPSYIPTPTSMTSTGTATSTGTLTSDTPPTHSSFPSASSTLLLMSSNANILSNFLPMSDTEKTWNSLSIAAVVVASVCGCIGVVYIGANLYRQKTRNKVKEIVVMMPRAVYEV